jgi:hypothetical protein
MESFVNKLEQLERALLEMGSELYRVKHELSDVRDNQTKFLKSMQSLKNLFDEKGLVTTDEFESAVDLVEIMNKMGTGVDAAQSVFERLKKVGH